MKKTYLLLLILSLLVTSACVDQKAGGKRKTSSAAVTNTDSEDDGTSIDDTTAATDISWFNGSYITGTMTLNEDFETVVYLRGLSIHNFLSTDNNANVTYCLVASYPTLAGKTLRLKATPIIITNFTSNTKERLLRVDVPSKTDNQAACSGSVSIVDAGEFVTGVDATGSYSLADICPSCSGKVTSTNISLYRRNETTLGTQDRIPSSTLAISVLSLRVDTKSNTTDPTTSCTDTECRARGYDCCLSGQCVNDGEEKPNASSESSYLQAVNDVLGNPSNYINYPEVYFVCGNNPNPGATPTPTATPDPIEVGQNEFTQLKLEYFCMLSGEKDPAEYDLGSCSTKSLLTEADCVASGKVWTPYCKVGSCSVANNQSKVDCEADSGTWTFLYGDGTTANGTADAYVAIRNDVWSRCGCAADPAPTDPEDPRCPDYGLKATSFDNNGVPTEIVCKIPVPEVEPTPIQNLNLSLPARTMPHRYFATDGSEYESEEAIQEENALLKLINSELKQEGTEFSYLDSSGKTDPQNIANNMNAILGQVSANLSQARPAKVFNVEFDQTYIIAATNGYYTPCPQCGNDSWFESFKAFPQSRNGTGLTAVGYTTDRAAYGYNTTNGNYEDNIFGRACFLPPTMIPFSHQPLGTTVQAQRLARLEAQSALFMNGYQRDWFGFNKGALIGSFDGSTWFAIGTGRRVRATSTKLYLAINAPFADLAENTDITVAITTDNGNNTAADFDYDPNLKPNDVRQNTGATCQYYHQCNVDSDCVTKLGWEYVCADVTKMKTTWPKYNMFAQEQLATERTGISIIDILQSAIPSGSAKRCVYRGAGSVCKQSFSTDLVDSNARKLVTCAPNFYCADIDSNSFNNEIIRSPAELETVLYGKEADVLGRPRTYVGASNLISSTAKSNINHNASQMANDITDWGLCRPGKAINTSVFALQHQSADSQNRTDYISQVGSCDHNATGNTRTQACPAFENEADAASGVAVGDYITTEGTGLAMRRKQNMCGAESRDASGLSPFADVEAGTLASLLNIIQPTLVRNACLRRAGSICHTNLDCGPNRMHAEQSFFYGLDYFGGTQAEKSYWEEELVCGQAQPKPFLTAEDFWDYDQGLNRCCRETGKDFTMYTQGNSTLIPDLGTDNLSLNTARLPSSGPSVAGRYSRYSVVDLVTNSASTVPVNEKPAVTSGQAPQDFQWKTLNDTGNLTCCGGWVRKFADGTTNWAVRNRLNIDVSQFSCLNYISEVHNTAPDFADANTYGAEADRLCLAPADGGCVQIHPFSAAAIDADVPAYELNGFEVDSFDITYPVVNDDIDWWVVNTSPLEDPANGTLLQAKDLYAPYQPIPYQNLTPPSGSVGPLNFMASPVTDYAASFYLPAYISASLNSVYGTGFMNLSQAIKEVKIVYFAEGGEVVTIRTATPDIDGGQLGACPGSSGGTTPVGWGYPGDPDLGGNALADEHWCLAPDNSNPALARTIFHIMSQPDLDGSGDPGQWAYAGVAIKFRPPGSKFFRRLNNAGTGSVAIGVDEVGLKPGNALYYLTKLARLELLGVPQMFYEPLYCNSNQSKLVPGIFDDNLSTRSSFEGSASTYQYGSVNGRDLTQIYNSTPSTDESNPSAFVGMQDTVQLPQVFSGHEFRCCLELGSKTTSASQCCSSFAVNDEESGGLACALPSGTNLNVYFNKFISSEGVGETQPGGGLLDTDFVPETGEPKLTSEVNAKIQALGQAYCASKTVRKGSAFGYFNAEPNNGYFQQVNDADQGLYYSIIDSTADSDPDNDTGTVRFLEGYRWDHQFYCQ